MGNVPLCWPLIQRVFQTGPWSRNNSSGGGKYSNSRATGGRANNTTRKGGAVGGGGGAAWAITSSAGPTPWSNQSGAGGSGSSKGGHDSDLEEGPYGFAGNVAEDQTSMVELTAGVGAASSSSRDGGHGHVDGDGGATLRPGAFWIGGGGENGDGKGEIVKTVEITTTRVHAR